MRKYKGVDIGRIVFACLVPFLHIGLPGMIVPFIQQYLARIGVPFFFAVAGMFLTCSLTKRRSMDALKRYAGKIGRLLLVWLLIYSPLLIKTTSIQELLFRTPAYLWYLSSLLVASVPFCLVKNRKILHVVATLLYVVGTVFGDSYKWLVGGVPQYEELFLTTRNGLFFGLPLMCIGELIWKKEKVDMKGYIIALIASGMLLIAEITLVGIFISPGDDRSMYLLLPGFVYHLLLVLKNWNPDVDTTLLGGISSAIYLMQFGVMAIVSRLLNMFGCTEQGWKWLILLAVLLVPTVVYVTFKDKKIVKLLF